MITNLLHIQSIEINNVVVYQTQEHLQKMGKLGHEGIALWVGEFFNDSFIIKTTLIPRQILVKTDTGVCYYVDADELYKINVWLYKNRMTLIAQIHSHPSEAYHSLTDDTFPIVTTIGGFSIVVPDYARKTIALDECAVYRLLTNGWNRITPAETIKIFKNKG